MEGLNPPLKCLIEIQAAIQNGETARVGLSRYLHGATTCDSFAIGVRRFLFAWDQGQNWRAVVTEVKSPHRRALLELIGTALLGQPILSHLEELRIELIRVTEAEIQQHLEMLPLKMLMPLLLFQFPAFLILLFGPLLTRLIMEINK
jgi:hypothetical protein